MAASLTGPPTILMARPTEGKKPAEPAMRRRARALLHQERPAAYRRPTHLTAWQSCRLAIAAAGALAAMLTSPPAHAGDPRLSTEWNRLAAALLTPLNAPDLVQHTPPPDPAAETLAPPAPPRWLGVAPRLSLVARDWAESRRLYGDLVLTDELRTTRSSRMVVGRVRLAEGLVAPFAQLGLGEWRVDTTLLPSLPHERELAAQAGIGFEIALAHDTTIALEADWTLLHPSDPNDILAQMHPALWGSSVALRTRF